MTTPADSAPSLHDAIAIAQAHPTLHVAPEPLAQLLHHVLEAEGWPVHSLSVVLANHAAVLTLNRTYLAHDYVTDVLSFDLRENETRAVEGEIYIDLDTATERHGEFGMSFIEEVYRYAVHGLLHLLGYSDATPEAKAHMHLLENRYLAQA